MGERTIRSTAKKNRSRGQGNKTRSLLSSASGKQKNGARTGRDGRVVLLLFFTENYSMLVC